MRSIKVGFVLIFVGVLVSAQTTLQPWESKPIAAWTAVDTKNILEASPWVKVVNGTSVVPLGTIPTVAKGSNILVLRSALPIRLAILRNLQLAAKYDSMSVKEKGDFDQRNAAVLACPLCDQFYVVSLVSNDPMFLHRDEIMSKKKLVFLSNDNGERRELVNFSARTGRDTQGAALFFFPRFDQQGKAFIDSKSDTLTFNLKIGSTDTYNIGPPQKVEFKVKDLTRDGQVIF